MVQAQVSVGGQGPRRYLLGLGRLESNTRPYGLDDRLNCMPHSPLPLLSLYAHTLSLLVHKCVGGRPPPLFASISPSPAPPPPRKVSIKVKSKFTPPKQTTQRVTTHPRPSHSPTYPHNPRSAPFPVRNAPTQGPRLAPLYSSSSFKSPTPIT